MLSVTMPSVLRRSHCVAERSGHKLGLHDSSVLCDRQAAAYAYWCCYETKYCANH